MIHRVLMIAPTPFFGDRGCHTQIYEQIRALKQLGIDVLLCTYPLGRDLPDVQIQRTWRPPWVNKEKIGPAGEKYFLDLLLLGVSSRAVERFHPDVIHAHLHEGALIGGAVRALHGVPVLFDLQGSLSGEMRAHGYFPENSLRHRFFKWIERKIDHWPDFVVTQAATMKEELVQSFGLPKDRVALTMDGVDAEVFKPGLDVTALRERLKIQMESPVVVYLGLLNHYQGVDCLIQSIPEVLRSVPEAIFLIMGYPDEARYLQMARDYGVPDRNIRFTGRIAYEEAPKYICLGTIAVSPKLGVTEANGKLYNYMACGLATVAFDNPVNREVLGETGLFATLGNASSLSENLTQLLTDAPRAQKMGDLARKRVVEKFSWDSVALRLRECYDLMLKERHG